MKITHPVTFEERTAIDKAIERRWKGAQEYAKEKSKETGHIYALTELPKSEYAKRAWRGSDYYQAYLYVDSTSIYWGVNTEVGDMPNVAKSFQFLLTGLRPRSTFDVPKDAGVCLPYLFVKDDGKDSRHIGMTYRLKAHPDITVWLEDASAATIGPHQNPNTFTAKGKANFFWTQHKQILSDIKSLWSFNQTFKDTTLAGQKGVKTYVELTRDDKEQTKDYGYLVAVRGDPKAKEDTPDLMLYVIQDSINAIKRDIKPLSKDEFLDMAETIAASVKRREVSAR